MRVLPVVVAFLSMPFVVAVVSFAQATQQWGVTLFLESGPTSGAFSCGVSGKGAIQVRNGVMSFFLEGEDPQTPRWQIPLSVDGSADASVPILTGRKGRSTHVTVPVGTGPRLIHSAGQNACRNRYEPN
jgi:hypothetical protein